jgi:hypothetical protein
MHPSVFIMPILVAWITPTAPAMLGGLVLASMPIIIHLLHRRRFKQTDWAAMEWLLEAIRKRSRLLNLEQLILLLIRTLLIVFVVLAMAKPVLNSAGVSLGSTFSNQQPVVHTIVVFDNSLSMQFATGNQTRWERAKKLVQQALESAGPGAQATALVMASPSRVLIREPSTNIAEVIKEIDGIKEHHGSASIEDVLEPLKSMLDSSKAARKRVLIVTDMQRSVWSSRSQAEDFPKRVQQLAGVGREFVVLDVGDSNSPNLAIVNWEQLQPTAMLKRPTLYRATLANFDSKPQENHTLEFLVDGEVQAVERVNVPAGGTPVQVVFSHSFRDPGERLVEVRSASPDALKADDTRRIGVVVRDALRVMLIDGQPSGEPFRSETDYLAIALAPDATSPIKPSVRPESDLLDAKLDDWDVVLLCNVASTSPSERNHLRDYLRRGGSVGFVLGSQVSLPSYNEGLFDNGKGILPVRLVEAIGDARQTDKWFSFDHLNYKHPIVQAFAGNENAGLLTAKTYRYVKVERPKPNEAHSRNVETALGFVGGDPAIVLSSFDSGRVAVVTTSADLDWNRWPISPSYLPVMNNLVTELASSRFKRPTMSVGQSLTIPLPKAGLDVAVSLSSPTGATTALPVDNSVGISSCTISDIDLSGAYRLKFGSPIDTEWPLAINTPTIESDLSRFSAEELNAAFPGLEFVVKSEWSADSLPTSDQLNDDTSFHRPLLWLALVFLFVETALAWRCGHHG